MPLYVYRCELGHATDALRSVERLTIICPECDGVAGRGAVYPISFAGGPTRSAKTPRDERDYRSSYRDFSEAGAELEYGHGRAEQRRGEKIAPPALFGAAMQKAAAWQAAGIKDSTEAPK